MFPLPFRPYSAPLSPIRRQALCRILTEAGIAIPHPGIFAVFLANLRAPRHFGLLEPSMSATASRKRQLHKTMFELYSGIPINNRPIIELIFDDLVHELKYQSGLPECRIPSLRTYPSQYTDTNYRGILDALECTMLTVSEVLPSHFYKYYDLHQIHSMLVMMELVTLQFCKCQDTECILSPSDIRIMSDIAARFLREASSVPTSDPYANLGAVCGYVEPSTEFQGIQRPEESRQSTAWQGPPPGLQSMPRGSATPPPPLPISSLASSPRQESAPSDTFFDALKKYSSQAAAAKETCLKALASQTASRVDLQVKFIRFLDSERARQERAKRAIEDLFGQDAKEGSGPANSDPGVDSALPPSWLPPHAGQTSGSASAPVGRPSGSTQDHGLPSQPVTTGPLRNSYASGDPTAHDPHLSAGPQRGDIAGAERNSNPSFPIPSPQVPPEVTYHQWSLPTVPYPPSPTISSVSTLGVSSYPYSYPPSFPPPPPPANVFMSKPYAHPLNTYHMLSPCTPWTVGVSPPTQCSAAPYPGIPPTFPQPVTFPQPSWRSTGSNPLWYANLGGQSQWHPFEPATTLPPVPAATIMPSRSYTSAAVPPAVPIVPKSPSPPRSQYHPFYSTSEDMIPTGQCDAPSPPPPMPPRAPSYYHSPRSASPSEGSPVPQPLSPITERTSAVGTTGAATVNDYSRPADSPVSRSLSPRSPSPVFTYPAARGNAEPAVTMSESGSEASSLVGIYIPGAPRSPLVTVHRPPSRHASPSARSDPTASVLSSPTSDNGLFEEVQEPEWMFSAHPPSPPRQESRANSPAIVVDADGDMTRLDRSSPISVTRYPTGYNDYSFRCPSPCEPRIPVRSPSPLSVCRQPITPPMVYSRRYTPSRSPSPIYQPSTVPWPMTELVSVAAPPTSHPGPSASSDRYIPGCISPSPASYPSEYVPLPMTERVTVVAARTSSRGSSPRPSTRALSPIIIRPPSGPPSRPLSIQPPVVIRSPLPSIVSTPSTCMRSISVEPLSCPDPQRQIQDLTDQFEQHKKDFSFPRFVDVGVNGSASTTVDTTALYTAAILDRTSLGRTERPAPTKRYHMLPFGSGRRVHQYLHDLDEILLKLDGIVCGSSAEVRLRRKAAVDEVMKEANVVERWKDMICEMAAVQEA